MYLKSTGIGLQNLQSTATIMPRQELYLNLHHCVCRTGAHLGPLADEQARDLKISRDPEVELKHVNFLK